MASWLKELISSAPVKETAVKEEEVVLGRDFKACDVCGSTRRTTSAFGGTLCAACMMAGHGQGTQGRSAGSQVSGRRSSGPSARNARPQGHGENETESRAAMAHTASLLDFGLGSTPSSSSRAAPSTRNRRSSRGNSAKKASPEVKPADDPLADLMRLPPPAAVGGRSSLPKSQSSPTIAQPARSRPESYRDQLNRGKLLALHQNGRATASNQSTAEATPPLRSASPAEASPKESRRHRRSEAEAMLRQQSALIAAKSQEEPLPGGYRCGEVVQSLISRERNFIKVLEQGHEGMVIGAAHPRPPSSRSGKHRDRGESMLRLLIQFKSGFDWVLAPHQICPPSFLASTFAAGLPGGFVWGDRVRSLVECLSAEDAARGFSMGDAGTIIGPGHTPGKVAVRFDKQGGEWNIWPGTVCRAEAFAAAVEAPLAGGFRRGDRVHTQATRSACTGESSTVELEDGEEGTVIGPGHAEGRILVRFDTSGRAWSMMPTQISVVGTSAVSKDSKETIVEMAAQHALGEPAVKSSRNAASSGGDTLPPIRTS